MCSQAVYSDKEFADWKLDLGCPQIIHKSFLSIPVLKTKNKLKEHSALIYLCKKIKYDTQVSTLCRHGVLQ